VQPRQMNTLGLGAIILLAACASSNIMLPLNCRHKGSVTSVIDRFRNAASPPTAKMQKFPTKSVGNMSFKRRKSVVARRSWRFLRRQGGNIELRVQQIATSPGDLFI
jgi:hypothetical protein